MNRLMKYIRKVLACLRKGDETFSLIQPKDRILVGISGGKDSMSLLYALSIYRKFSQKDFSIVPVSLDLGFPGFDPTSMKEFASSLGLELKVDDSSEVYPILLAHTKEGHHIPCSICSRMKKAAINASAKKYHCNKVAFAHHQDDALETLWMNMIHGGKIATFEPEMRLSRAGITFIRPFIFVREEDIKGLVEEEHIPVLGKTCPADGFTEREYVKNKLKAIYEERPEAISNLSSMLYNHEPFLLYFDRIHYAIPKSPSLSLKPCVSPGNVIAYNQLFAKGNGLTLMKGQGKTFFYCQKKKIIGRVDYSFENSHTLIIHENECLKKEYLYTFFDAFIKRILSEVNPLYTIYKGKGKKFAREYGFKKSIAPGHMNELGLYLKK